MGPVGWIFVGIGIAVGAGWVVYIVFLSTYKDYH